MHLSQQAGGVLQDKGKKIILDARRPSTQDIRAQLLFELDALFHDCFIEPRKLVIVRIKGGQIPLDLKELRLHFKVFLLRIGAVLRAH